jgi:hypothetical protein
MVSRRELGSIFRISLRILSGPGDFPLEREVRHALKMCEWEVVVWRDGEGRGEEGTVRGV